MRKTVVLINLAWFSLVAAAFAWNYVRARTDQFDLAMETARASFEQVLLTRAWVAGHGGVYVPITGNTVPNPYLVDPLREIQVDSALTLTKINPSYMTRQIAELAEQRQGIKFHITSLRPLRPENRPTAAEAEALRAFEQGVPEIGRFVGDGPNRTFFYMAPLLTEPDCLTCHAHQGYRPGDIRGGISVVLPFVSQFQPGGLLFSYLGIGLAGALGIFAFSLRLNQAYDTLQRQATVDALTGIPNRRNFAERIQAEAQRSARDRSELTVIMVDIDNFKAYNDLYGHQRGDACLADVARTLAGTLKRPGDFCARYGGEEFVVILPNTPCSGGAAIAEEIRKGVSGLALPHAAVAAGHVTVSLGVATGGGEAALPWEALLKQADQALYLAKCRGRDRVENFEK